MLYFSFLNYAYDAISYRYDNRITVRDGECYVGQPYTGYALNKDGNEEFIILGVLMHLARQYKQANAQSEKGRLSDKILRYMGEHTDAVTLKSISQRFSYHPNYISSLLHRELGKTFSQLLLELRMGRTVLLLRDPACPLRTWPSCWATATAAISIRRSANTINVPHENI